MMKPVSLAVAYLALVTLPLAAGTDRWTAVGPDGGRVTGLAADAQGTWYAADGSSGFFRSADGGASWVRLGAAPPGLVGRLEVAGRRFWAAGGPFRSGVAVSTSADGGATWREVSPPSFADGSRWVQGLAVSPAAPGWAYVAHDAAFAAGADRGAVELTTDGGRTWRTVLSATAPSAIAVAPSNGQVAYVGVDSFIDRGAWLLVTRNGGRSWSPRQPPPEVVSPEGYAPRIWALAVEPANPKAVLVLTASAILRSEDRGATWTVFSLATPHSAHAGIAVDPRQPRRWLVWGRGGVSEYGEGRRTESEFVSIRGWVRGTSDGGATWSPVQPLDEIHQVAWDPRRPGRALAAVSRLGVVASSDAGASWRLSHSGLKVATVCSLTPDFHPGGGVVAGLGVCSSDGGVATGDDGGYLRFQQGRWTRLNRGLRDPLWLLSAIGAVVDPSSPGSLYALTGYGLARSPDGGRSWSSLRHVAADGVVLTDLVLDPDNPRRLLAGGWKYVGLGRTLALKLFQSDDEGSTWDEVPIPRLAEARGAFRRLKMVWQQGSTYGETGRHVVFDPLTEGRLLAFWPGSESVEQSTDGGVTWRGVGADLPPGTTVAQVVFDPQRAGLAYLLDQAGNLFVSEDAGGRWRLLNVEGLGGVTALALAIDPEHPETLYAGTEGGGGFFVLTRSDR